MIVVNEGEEKLCKEAVWLTLKYSPSLVRSAWGTPWNLRQDGWFPNRDSNAGPPKYEAGVLSTPLRRLVVSILWHFNCLILYIFKWCSAVCLYYRNIGLKIQFGIGPSGPRRLRHVLSSTARTLGSCFRIPLEACMCVRVFLYCVLLCK
jgi:hypothetical protein